MAVESPEIPEEPETEPEGESPAIEGVTLTGGAAGVAVEPEAEDE